MFQDERQKLLTERLRIKGFSINRLLPNILTILSLTAGLTSVRFALLERFDLAVGAILVAAIFDMLDGRVARLLNATSKFGAELDSLSDNISFGVAPGLILYLWSLSQMPRFGWLVVLVLAICCALRLARFNTMLDAPDPRPWAGQFFTGVPAPAAALLALLPMVINFETDWALLQKPAFISAWGLAVALLMVSRWPTFSFKKMHVPLAYVVPVLVMVGLLVAALITEIWLTLSIIGVLYIILLPVSLWRWQKLAAQS